MVTERLTVRCIKSFHEIDLGYKQSLSKLMHVDAPQVHVAQNTAITRRELLAVQISTSLADSCESIEATDGKDFVWQADCIAPCLWLHS